MRRLAITLTCCLGVLVTLPACGSRKKAKQPIPGGGESVAAGTRVIAVIPKGTTHVFWQSVHAGALKAGKECNCEIVWTGPLREGSRDEQAQIVESMINKGVAGIVLAPTDETALRAPVAAAKGKGIPVVIIDSGLKGDDFVSFVATDNYVGGKKGGQELAKLLGGKGKVVMLRYQVGSDSTTNRERGFLDAMKENPGIEVVSSEQYAGDTRDKAMNASEGILMSFRTEDGGIGIDGVFCPNESSTYGMLRALQSMQLAGKVKFVGFDSAEELVTALKKGEINGLVVQDPFNMGYLGVKKMAAHLDGTKVDARIDTGSTIVSPENIEEPTIKQLLSPGLGK